MLFVVVVLAVAAVAGVVAKQSGARPTQNADRVAIREPLTVRPRTLLTLRRTITAVATGGSRVAFLEYDISCAKAPRCNADTVDLWSRRTKRLHYRDPCPGEEWIVISGRAVYWECDEVLLSLQRTRIFGGVPSRKKALLVARSDNTMSLAGDGQQAFFSAGPRLWRLEGGRRRVVLRGSNADGDILDVDSGRILTQRYDDGRLVLLDRGGRALHVFSPRFRCCITTLFVLSGETLVMETDAGIVEFYDISSEALTRRLDLEPGRDPSLSDIEHGFALYGLDQSGFHILNMATGRDTLIRTRGNDLEGSATFGPDGVYYVEQVRHHGRLQFLTYAQLANP